MAYADLDLVALARDTEGLAAGAVGTVVGVYGNLDGQTRAVLTLGDTDIELVENRRRPDGADAR
jgi:uncharacterized membrane protein